MQRKNIVLIVVSIVALSTIFGLVYLKDFESCENGIITEMLSPNKEMLALYFERSCQNNPKITTQIAIVNASRANKRFYTGKGNVLSFEGEPPQVDLELEWIGDEQLAVTGIISNKIIFKYDSVEVSGNSIGIKYLN